MAQALYAMMTVQASEIQDQSSNQDKNSDTSTSSSSDDSESTADDDSTAVMDENVPTHKIAEPHVTPVTHNQKVHAAN